MENFGFFLFLLSLFFLSFFLFFWLSVNWGCATSETVAQKMVIIRTERADPLPLVHSLYSTALLLAQHQVPPDLLYVFGSRLFLHTHTHTYTYTCTNSLYFCYTAASGAENKKSRFVLACFLPSLPLSSMFSPSLSFLLLLPFHPYLVSFFPPHSSLTVVASLSSPPMRCCDAASNRHQ